MSAGNVRGWEIVQKMNIWPRSEGKFWGQSLSQGHYQPTYQQARKGFIYFTHKPLVNMVKKPAVIWCTWLTWGSKVNLIGLTNFISTVIGANLTSCHLKLILVTPLGYLRLTVHAKTWLERNVFQSQNLHLWNAECVKSVSLEGGLIFRRSLARDGVLQLACCLELKVTGFHLALVFTASLSEVGKVLNHAEFTKLSGAFRPSWFAA